MDSRQRPWPRQWLMTDERMGERLWSAIDHLPAKHAGIVFRHYALPSEARLRLACRIADVCKRQGLALAIAADVELARTLEADLVHNPSERVTDLPFSRAVHSIEEAERASLEGASLVFISPVFPTSSHPGRKALYGVRALQIARAAGVPAIALGGMNALKSARLEQEGFYGWAGIDAWLTASA